MNIRLLAALLCLTAASTGCIIDGGQDDGQGPGPGPSPVSGDVSFLWSFAGTATTAGRCVDVPEVQKVRLTIPGQTLTNGGLFPCNVDGVDGTLLRNLAPGIYNYAIEALSGTDAVLYTVSGSFTVDGNRLVSATLSPISRQPVPGNVSFRWSFAGSTSAGCAQVPEVKKVRITIPGQTLTNGGLFACNTAGVDGITLQSFSPGTYSYIVEALGSTDTVLYKGGGSFTVDGDKLVSVTLDPTVSPPVSGDVSFRWSFSGPTGSRCVDVPEVKTVRITIPGQTLVNGGVFACNTAGVDGITLQDFAPGPYSYTVEALGSTNTVLYKGSGSFTVNGDKLVSVTLISERSFAYVSWSFPANTSSSNPTCSQAGVVSMDVRIDAGEWTRLDCMQGSGGSQVASPYLSPGAHTIELIGVGSSGQPYYYVSGTLNIQPGSPTAVSYALWAVGSMALRWELLDGSALKTCAQAGVTGMTINLLDLATETLIFGAQGDPQPCDGAPIIYRFLRPGSYRVYIRGTGTGVFYTNEANAPTLTVTAFQQKTETDAFTLYPQRQ